MYRFSSFFNLRYFEQFTLSVHTQTVIVYCNSIVQLDSLFFFLVQNFNVNFITVFGIALLILRG